jgi:HEAT repeat protein
MKKTSILSGLFMLLALFVAAQDDIKKVKADRLILKNGNRIVGEIWGENETEVVIIVKGIRLGVRKEQIAVRDTVILKVKVPKHMKGPAPAPVEPTPPVEPEPDKKPKEPTTGDRKAPTNIAWPEVSKTLANNVTRSLMSLRTAEESKKEKILEQLVEGEDETQIYLAEKLFDFEDQSRWVLTAIGRIQSDAAFPYLQELIPYLSDQTRGFVFMVLGTRQYHEAAPVIAKYLPASESGKDTRAAAVTALSKLNAAGYVDDISAVLLDAETTLASIVVAGLKSLSKDNDIKSEITYRTLQLLESEEKQALFNGAMAASELQVTEAGPKLEQLVRHEEREVRAAACKSIQTLRYREAAQAIADRLVREEDSRTKYFMIRALDSLLQGSGKIEFVPFLLPLLEDEETENQNAAASALTSITGQTFGTDRYAWEEWYQKQIGGR